MHKSVKGLTAEKAGEILRHGEVRGKKLSKAQRGYFGAVRGGNAKKKARLHGAMRSLASKRRGDDSY